MEKYRVFEKVKDKYIIQNKETLELELIDEKTYKEGMSFQLLEWYNLRSEITRKLLVDKEYDTVLFSSKYYDLVYCNVVKDWNTRENVIRVVIKNVNIYTELVLPIYLFPCSLKFNVIITNQPPKETDKYFFNLILQPVGSITTAECLFQNCSVDNVDLT